MTKQEADKIIADTYPKCRIEYKNCLSGLVSSQPDYREYLYVVDGIRVWVCSNGSIHEEHA